MGRGISSGFGGEGLIEGEVGVTETGGFGKGGTGDEPAAGGGIDGLGIGKDGLGV